MKVVVAIIAGGTGSRLWPMSRQMSPKYLLALNDGQTLLQKTYDRARMIPDVVDVSIVTNRETYFLIEQECSNFAASANLSFILEPVHRNTCAAVCAATFSALSHHGENVCVLVLPADHIIEPLREFIFAVQLAVEAATADRLVTFGVPATYPETGYGYIEHCTGVPGEYKGVTPAKRFIEKPQLDVARRFVGSGRHLWNTGMMCFRPTVLLQEMECLVPRLTDAVRRATISARHFRSAHARVSELQCASFQQSDHISIDRAILERSKRVSVVECTFNWRDIGSWKAMSELVKPDSAGNQVDGDVRLLDTAGCYFQSDGRVIGAIGLKDVIVVDTPDALLIAAKDRTQEVGQLVEELKADGHHSIRSHETEQTPWGSYTRLAGGDEFKVKRLVIKPRACLSLQSHRHRGEHWVVAQGTAEAIVGDRVTTLRPPDSTFVPAGTKHRLANVGTDELIVIELQFGKHLREDDIVRFDDIYGRGPQ